MRFATISIVLLASIAAIVPNAEAAYDTKKLLCAINKYRKQNGKPYLTTFKGLDSVAQVHNDIQAQRQELAYQFDDETDLIDRIKEATGTDKWWAWAQLVARGYKDEDTYAKILSADSRTKDIFNGNYTHVGLARNDSANGPWWTQTLAYRPNTKPTTVECPK
ncbi:hypothetical protein BDF19DRAFT_412733 [Syncephalis fuscata]|nr:hypothetical protein BDF19DRAFT_412733 [Syncephalis fuscata]